MPHISLPESQFADTLQKARKPVFQFADTSPEIQFADSVGLPICCSPCHTSVCQKSSSPTRSRKPESQFADTSAIQPTDYRPYAPKSKKTNKFFDKGAKKFKLCCLPEHQNKRQQQPNRRLQHHPNQHCQIDKINKHSAPSPSATTLPVLNPLWERNRKPVATRLHRVF